MRHHYITAKTVKQQRYPHRPLSPAQRGQHRPPQQEKSLPWKSRYTSAPMQDTQKAVKLPPLAENSAQNAIDWQKTGRMYAGIGSLFLGLSGTLPPEMATLGLAAAWMPLIPTTIKEHAWSAAWTIGGAVTLLNSLSPELTNIDRIMQLYGLGAAFVLGAEIHSRIIYTPYGRLHGEKPDTAAAVTDSQSPRSNALSIRQAVRQHSFIAQGIEYLAKRIDHDPRLAKFFDIETPSHAHFMQRLRNVKFAIDLQQKGLTKGIYYARYDCISLFTEGSGIVAHECAHALHTDTVRRQLTLQHCLQAIDGLSSVLGEDVLAEADYPNFQKVYRTVRADRWPTTLSPSFRRAAAQVLFNYAAFMQSDLSDEGVASTIWSLHQKRRHRLSALALHYFFRPMLAATQRLHMNHYGAIRPYSDIHYQARCIAAGPIGCLLNDMG